MREVAVVQLVSIFIALSSAVTAQTTAAVTHTIEGRVIWPDTLLTAAKIKLMLGLEDGRTLYGWPKADGSFVLNEVPEGTHLLDVIATGLIYPEVRLEVNGAFPGKALVTLADDRSKIIPPPLILRPTSLAEYFEVMLSNHSFPPDLLLSFSLRCLQDLK